MSSGAGALPVVECIDGDFGEGKPDKPLWGTLVHDKGGFLPYESPAPPSPAEVQCYNNVSNYLLDSDLDDPSDRQSLGASQGSTDLLGSYLPVGLTDDSPSQLLGSYLPVGLTDDSSSRPYSPTCASASSSSTSCSSSSSSSSCSSSSSSSSSDSNRPSTQSPSPEDGRIVIQLSRRTVRPRSPQLPRCFMRPKSPTTPPPMRSPVLPPEPKSPPRAYVPSFEPNPSHRPPPGPTEKAASQPIGTQKRPPGLTKKPVSPRIGPQKLLPWPTKKPVSPPIGLHQRQVSLQPTYVPTFQPTSPASPMEDTSMEGLISSLSANMIQRPAPFPKTPGTFQPRTTTMAEPVRMVRVIDDDVDMAPLPECSSTPATQPPPRQLSSMEVVTSAIVTLRHINSNGHNRKPVGQAVIQMDIEMTPANRIVKVTPPVPLPITAFPFSRYLSATPNLHEPMETESFTILPISHTVSRWPTKSQKRKYSADEDGVRGDNLSYPAKRRRLESRKRKYVKVEDVEDEERDLQEYATKRRRF